MIILRALTICFALTLVSAAFAQEKKADAPPAQTKREPTAAEISKTETLASAFLRTFKWEEYEFRSAAENMPADKYDYRPAAGLFQSEKPEVGPSEVRTFGEQVKHVACANFAFAAEMDGKKPPEACDRGGPNAAKTRDELVVYLRDSFKALNQSIMNLNDKNKFDPIEGPYAGPNTRFGIAQAGIWHVADHYGQIVIYMRLNGIVPPASRATPTELMK
ncbi:MAG TPA: DinB family protein [Candidatus Acidoferrum sp.]|jgi:uncharacterized damage-inducible protein DinB